jgi:hypothetical protein
MHHRRIHRRRTGKGHPATQQLEQDNAQRVDVGAAIDGLALRHFGCDIFGRRQKSIRDTEQMGIGLIVALNPSHL